MCVCSIRQLNHSISFRQFPRSLRRSLAILDVPKRSGASKRCCLKAQLRCGRFSRGMYLEYIYKLYYYIDVCIYIYTHKVYTYIRCENVLHGNDSRAGIWKPTKLQYRNKCTENEVHRLIAVCRMNL